MSSENSPSIGAFLDIMAAERGASPLTRAAYGQDLRGLEMFLNPVPLTDASESDLERYLAFLSQKGYESRSKARKLATIRQFYGTLCLDEIRADNPAERLKPPKLGKSLPKVVSISDVNQLLSALNGDPSPHGTRLRCLLELVYGAGLRVSELVGIPLESAVSALKDPRPVGSLVISGKGGRMRMVPLSPPARTALRAYLDSRSFFLNGGPDTGFLFPSSGKTGCLTRQRFGQLLKTLALGAGIDPARLSPHVLRHAFASHLVSGGADLLSVQKLLGHAHIATTEIYTHVQTDRLRDAVMNAHPLSHKGAGGT